MHPAIGIWANSHSVGRRLRSTSGMRQMVRGQRGVARAGVLHTHCGAKLCCRELHLLRGGKDGDLKVTVGLLESTPES